MKLKKLLAIACSALLISASTYAGINMVVGTHTVHMNDVDNQANLNNDNKLLSLELQYKETMLNASTFENSFSRESWAVGLRRHFGDTDVKMVSGIMLVKGYTEEEVWDIFYWKDEMSFLPVLGYNIKITDNFSLDMTLLGAALNTALKFKIK